VVHNDFIQILIFEELDFIDLMLNNYFSTDFLNIGMKFLDGIIEES
jgi:hypothetical protein